MLHTIKLKNKEIQYNLQYKSVKNINLRIKPDGEINVSANRRVTEQVIEEFIISKADFILRAIELYEQRSAAPQKQYYGEDEIQQVVLEICERVYPYFQKLGIKYPKIKFRKMVSRWGSCHKEKGVLTFNTNLIYADHSCIEYVVLHEFTHFLQANHSNRFYEELEKSCPDWKERRKILKKIIIR